MISSERKAVVGVTGHRKFHPSLPESDTKIMLEKLLNSTIGASSVISGMALGFDQLVADVCVECGIPFVAAIPFEGQENVWNEKQQMKYYELLLKAKEVVVVTDGGWISYRDNWKFQERNKWIVDNSDILCSYLFEEGSGGKATSGTKNCVKYAIKSKPDMKIYNLFDVE